MKNNAVGWFEIPVNDMDRAIKFYETVFGFELQRNQMGPLDMAWFPWSENGSGANGSLVHHPDFYVPSSQGTLVYFTAHSGDLSNELARVEGAGGQVIQEKKLITEDIGFMGLFIDSEGNRVAIHSRE
ncbi:MAG: VOC family protein [Fulvivirga sp.]|nr:VOC family protein [Fulvivirga sp.]